MSDCHSDLDDVLDEILERAQRGERLDVESLCEAQPEIADDLRRLLPSLLIMEGVKPVPEHQSDRTADMPPPQQLGEYRILGEIGRGGMGVVYEAEQMSLGRNVALKVLPHLSARDETAVRRFEREARAAARLHHTNIVPVFDVGQSGDTCYYTMQLIRGASLDAVLEKLPQLRDNSDTGPAPTSSGQIWSVDAHGPNSSSDDLNSRIAVSLLNGRFRPKNFIDSSTPSAAASDQRSGSDARIPSTVRVSARSSPQFQANLSMKDRRRHRYWRSVARIGLQAAEALAYSHAHGVVHRDIKPANLILDEDGIVWITDFGLAMTEDSGMTQTGDVLGTLRYLPPERFDGECTERSDVYALGITLYELLAFRPAFGASNRLRLIEAIRNGKPAALRQRDRQIPRDLETIVLKACDREPASRYQSAVELHDDLGRFLSDEPIQARRASIVEQTVRWARRNQRLAGSLLTIAVLLALFAAGASLAFFRESKFLHESEVANSRLQRQLYAYEIQLAAEAYQANNVEVVRKRLDNCPPELRDWEWYRFDRLSKPKHVLEINGFERPIFLPDGKHLVTAGHRGGGDANTAKVWDLSTGHLFGSKMATRGNVTSLALSSDGEHLVTGSGIGVVALWDMNSRVQLWSVSAHTAKVDGAAISPDGTRIATVSWDQTLKIIDTTSGRVQTNVGPLGHRVRCAEFSPSGAKLVTASYMAENATAAKVWDADSGRLLLELHGHASSTESVAFSPRGHQIVTGDTDGTVTLWDAESGVQLRTFQGHTGEVEALAFSSTGEQFASGSSDRSIRVWDLETAQETMLYRTGGPVAWLSFSRDGRSLASFGGRSVKVWALEGAKDVLMLDHGGRALDCEFSPDGNRIASCGDDGTIKIWDVATGMLLHVLQGHEARVSALAWHPDDGSIASVSFDQSLRLWDTESGQLTNTYFFPGKRALKLAFSTDGKQVAVGSIPKSISILDISSGKVLHNYAARGVVSGLAWSPDNRFLVSGHLDQATLIWNVSSGKIVRRFEGNQSEVVFTSDGSGVIAGGRDGTIRVFDVEDGGVSQQFDGHQSGVRSLALGPRGRRLVSGGSEVKLWDAASGEELFSPREHRNGALAVSFSADAKMIASAAADGTIAIWESSGSSAQWQARSRIGKASVIVDRLFHQYIFKADVVRALRRNDELAADVRELSTTIANRRGDDALRLFKEGWSVFITQNKDEEVMQLARRKILAACTEVPESAAFHTGLGMAEFRLANYEEALDLLMRARHSDIVKSPVVHLPNVGPGQKAVYPVNLAFATMTLHRLGQTDRAEDELNRLRELLKDERWIHYLEATTAYEEAERIMAGTE